MPEVEINIGGRAFEVACQAGEEHYLQTAAAMLDKEATTLSSQIGRLPEARMLLMAGLMLADKTAGQDDKLRDLKAKLDDALSELEKLRNAPPPEPEQVQVAVVPDSVTDSLAELAARAEALAAEVEEKAG
ncbi:cell division protein ZapA [Alisedimentitalea sp. MJ-SS2]|uniref:cell division protein ZapA n=1 Tax=Aliisedimentitalea sp. MJ-SS2 TaxID=3049795 RepID=UPI002914E83E|nr:cell division protein ZapA [Alisedimentitalea sp. MJ-SS2]MDU8929185.1 cell division protein ZapA [Alisedimentitalea sp. MJ-SS2]